MLKQSFFDLNGPYLSFIEQPVGVTTTNGGPVTLVGIATASFKTGVSTDSPDAPDNPAVGSGSLTYQWYEVGVDGAADTVVVDDIDDGGVISGAGTTALTILKAMSPQDDEKEYYVVADYTPSTTTGNAPNEPVSSEIATISVYSLLEIVDQPSNKSNFIDVDSNFYVGAKVSGGNIGDNITYQWYLDEGSDTYNTQLLYRFYDSTSYDHYCSNNYNPASGYYSEGGLCSLFTEQAPGTIGIIDAEADSRGVDRPDTGVVGYGYPDLAAAEAEGNSNVIPIYKMVRDDLTTIDEMWSTSPNEGVGPVSAIVTITPDIQNVAQGGAIGEYIWDTSEKGSVESYRHQAAQNKKGYFRPTTASGEGITYTIKSNVDITVDIEAKGAAGGYNRTSRTDGGSGGLVKGKFTFIKNQEYLLRVGGKGFPGSGGGVNLGPESRQGGWNGGGDALGWDNGGGGPSSHEGSSGGGYTGLFLKSGTLNVWTTNPGISGYASWYGVAYGDGKFVAVGVNGAMYSTDDGVTWTSASLSQNQHEWRSVTYGDGKFVAVAQSGITQAMYSTNGINWTNTSVSIPTDWQSVTYGDGKFVAVASSTSLDQVMYSTDGITWITANSPSAVWMTVTYGDKRFVAVGSDVSAGGTTMYSDDGINWTQVWTPNGGADPDYWRSVTYGVDSNGNGKFVAGATDGTNRLMYSSNGTSWTLVASPSGTTSNGWYSMASGGGKFVAVSPGPDSTNRTIFSDDGITWTAANPVEDSDDDWRSVTFGAGRFVAVSSEQRSDGSGTHVTYSSYMGDGNIQQSNAILIAAGGGGAANDGAGASAGGGLAGETLTAAWNRRGGPGTQNNGGEGGGNSQSASAANGPGLTVGEAGSSLQGGKGASGGGGGYYGGGGGVTGRVAGSDGDGGGGSSYMHPALLSEASTVTGGGANGSYSIGIERDASPWNDEYANGEFRMEATNYSGGNSFSGQYHSGSVDNIFDGSLDTNLDGVPNDFNIYFTNLPIPTTSLRFYLFQDASVECILKTGSYNAEDDITCGTFNPTSTAGGNESNFLAGAACNASYIRPNDQTMSFNASVPLRVSAGDVISLLCQHDNPRHVVIDLLIEPRRQTDPVLLGIAPNGENWNACNGNWVTTTLIEDGILVGLRAQGGVSNDALGLGYLKINGTLIYPGQTYTTKGSSISTVIKTGDFGMDTNPRGGWVNVDSSAWANKNIKSLWWPDSNVGWVNHCGLAAIEIDGAILVETGGYINKGIKFYAPTTSLDVSTLSSLLTDGEMSRSTTTVRMIGAPDGYSSYLAAALPLNDEYQFTNQSALISGKTSNATSHQIGGVEVVNDATISALSGVGNISKFYGSSARKPIGYSIDSTQNPSYIKVNTPGKAFGTGDFCIEYWQFVDKYNDFGDWRAVGIDINYPPARDGHTYGEPSLLTPFIRLQDGRIRYYEWDATPWLSRDTLGYGGRVTYKKWQHIAITRQVGRVSIFIDGEQTGSFNDPTNYTGTAYAMFAGIWRLTEGFYIQDLRIYSGTAKYINSSPQTSIKFTPPSQMLIYEIKEKKSFNEDASLLLPPNTHNIQLTVAGGKGGKGGHDPDGVGGSGGKGRQGTFRIDDAAAGETLTIKVGKSGNDGPSCYGTGANGGIGGGGNGGDSAGCSGAGAGGGGASSVSCSSLGDGNFVIAAGGGGGGGGAAEKDGGQGSDGDVFITSNTNSMYISDGSDGKDASGDGSGGGAGGAGASGGIGGEGGSDNTSSATGGGGGTSKYYSVSTIYKAHLIYRFYAGRPTYDHYCSTDTEPRSGHTIDGPLCRIYTEKAPYTVPIRDNEEPSRYDGPIMGYAYPHLQAVYDAGLTQGNVRPIYALEGKNRWGLYDIMWSIHDNEAYPTYKNTGVKFYAPWTKLTVTDKVGGDTFSIIQSQTLNDGDGFVDVSWKYTNDTKPEVPTSEMLTISGSRSDTLRLSSNFENKESVYCQVSSELATNSPLDSESASCVFLGPTGRITVESIGGGIAQIADANLQNGDFEMGNWSSNASKMHLVEYISFYSPDSDMEIEMDMYGGKGKDWFSPPTSSGGQGGYSRIRFTMEKNVEYVLAGLTNDIRAPFLYRKGQLMAVVGGGGASGSTHSGNGDGGIGGGVGVAGGDSKGNSGSGGTLVSTLGANGIFGSIMRDWDNKHNLIDGFTPYAGDSVATGPGMNFGGQTIKCTKGVYWAQRGVGACDDLGFVKFRLEDGTEMTNTTSSITRGFKAGYNIMQTAGIGYQAGANGPGGNGATGGDGGYYSSTGGGGGSGYQDGSVTVIDTMQGGSTGDAKVVLRLPGTATVTKLEGGNSFADLVRDAQGRILIFSSTGISDPRNLNKSSVVEPGSNSCINDETWRYILDLARDGTKDYRLTGCAPNGNYGTRTKITSAQPRNIYRMMNANRLTLRTSLTDWTSPGDAGYPQAGYGRLALAWDETSGGSVTGSDYSMLWWTSSGWGYYGLSSNSFFYPTKYYQKSAEYWILPPGVPDF